MGGAVAPLPESIMTNGFVDCFIPLKIPIVLVDQCKAAVLEIR
jgi:hypothetical protein